MAASCCQLILYVDELVREREEDRREYEEYPALVWFALLDLYVSCLLNEAKCPLEMLKANKKDI
jgi:hypothetical protein